MLACAAVAPAPLGTLTEGGRYRVAVAQVADGVEVVLTDPAGRSLEHAAVHVEARGGVGLDDPGECDDIGPERCFHPGGRYRSRIALGGERTVEVTVDGPDGEDRVVLDLPGPR